MASHVFTSCVGGTADCQDAGGTLVGPPLWLIIVGAVVIVAIVCVVVIGVVIAARRRRATALGAIGIDSATDAPG